MDKNMRGRISRFALYIFLGLLAYMPLHILISTWVGTSVGILPLAKVAKDIVLVIGFLALVAATPWRKIIELVMTNRVAQLMIGYGLLTLLLAALRPVDQDAETLGVVYNLRFFVMFSYAVLLCQHFEAKELIVKSAKLVLAVSIPVMVFGLLQYLVLSPTALTNVGYARENGVLPFFAIDDKPDLERVMSTVRDPNSYGSYLLVIGTLALSVFICTKRRDSKKMLAGVIGLVVINLALTFSRSAWIGFVLAALAVVLLGHHRPRLTSIIQRHYLTIGLVVVLLFTGFVALKDTYFVQNVVFHADESTVLENPNELRSRFLVESVDAIADSPLGHGPGTAGIVSIRNDQKTVLNENYYLQIGYEVGVLGLVVFLAILVILGLRLYRQNDNTYVVALLASLVGLSFTNLLVHIWSNEAVAYTWWALAGLLLSKLKK
jgi:hypothetical protein